MKKIIFTAYSMLFVLLATSCSITKPIKSHTAYYTINLKPNISKQEKRIDKTLIIESARCKPQFNSQLFFYKDSQYRLKPYAYSRWIDSVCNMVKDTLITSFSRCGMFKFTGSSNTLINYDYKLIFSIDEFEPIFTDKKNYIQTEMVFSLIDLKTHQIIDGFSCSNTINITHIDMNNIVSGMNFSMQQCILHTLNRINKTLSLQK